MGAAGDIRQQALAVAGDAGDAGDLAGAEDQTYAVENQ